MRTCDREPQGGEVSCCRAQMHVAEFLGKNAFPFATLSIRFKVKAAKLLTFLPRLNDSAV
jgi:hypothetical protein